MSNVAAAHVAERPRPAALHRTYYLRRRGSRVLSAMTVG